MCLPYAYNPTLWLEKLLLMGVGWGCGVGWGWGVGQGANLPIGQNTLVTMYDYDLDPHRRPTT